ncbi:hypothetical protein ACKC9G_05385 [Pokkaliibacter sp. CJK22405]|uniref:hypothetical protein n=1 Tax=Pokkaliibacter sp. CJK22405 TaxID=3384615 RepID=UPI003984DA3E
MNEHELLDAITQACNEEADDTALGKKVRALINQFETEQNELSDFLSDCGDACKL